MAATRAIGGGIAWMAAANWTEQAVNFIVFTILARMLGAEALGTVAMAFVFVFLSEVVVRESVSEGLISAETATDADRNVAFWTLAALGIALMLALWLMAGTIAELFGVEVVAGLVAALALTIPLIAVTAVPVAILRRDMRFRALSIRAVLGVLAGGVAGVGMAFAGYGVWSLIGQRLAQVGVNAVLAWSASGWMPGLRLSGDAARRIGGFGGKVVGLRLAEAAAVQVPQLLIGTLLGPMALGFYSAAWRLIDVLATLIVTPVLSVAQPAFAALARADGSPGDLLRRLSSVMGFLALPAFFGVAAIAPDLLVTLFGPGWIEAAVVVRILALLGAYFCIEKLNQSFCLAMGVAGRITLAAWATVALSAMLMLVIGGYGLGYTAFAVVAGFLIVWPVRLAITAGTGALTAASLVAVHLRPLAAALVMSLLVASVAGWLDLADPRLSLPVGILLGVVVYVILSALFMRDRLRALMLLAVRRQRPGETLAGH
jgi:PST family polysaccharide transporter